MTPMIDVVFQLIVVFLCSMKFRTLDMKVEATLPEEGMSSVFRPPPPPRPCAALRLRRAAPGGETRVLLLDTPLGPAGEETWTALGARLSVLHGRDASVYGEIDADPEVDHGEVMRALDAFLGAAFTEVRFRGTGKPPGLRGRR